MSLDKNKNRPYSIQEYDPTWPTQFADIRNLLEEVFAMHSIEIEHIGSTSIPGIKAKPLIDILVIVDKMTEFEDEKKMMEEYEYKWGENYIEPNSIIFYKEGIDGKKIENIHVCLRGSPKAIQFITTRDYLRVHPARAAAYSDLKVYLKEKYPDDYLAYRRDKQSFIDETERLTKEWMRNRNNN